MTTPAYELRLIEDKLYSGTVLELPADNINRVVYVAHGSIKTSEGRFEDNSAWCGRGAARLVAEANGAALWRFEVVLAGAAVTSASVKAGTSRVKLTAPLKWPTRYCCAPTASRFHPADAPTCIRTRGRASVA